MAELLLPKQVVRVRFPSLALKRPHMGILSPDDTFSIEDQTGRPPNLGSYGGCPVDFAYEA